MNVLHQWCTPGTFPVLSVSKTICGASLALLLSLSFYSNPALSIPPNVTVETLLHTNQTILGQSFEYPEGVPEVTVSIITIYPHTSIALHKHPVPLVAYILQGELVVEYETEFGLQEIYYKSGDAFVEAFNVPHRGYNGGRGLVKILAVYAGAEGVPNSLPVEE
jgi:quercetin dioxygenase-like cupin family protein